MAHLKLLPDPLLATLCYGYILPILITIYGKTLERETFVVRIENECSQENFCGSSFFS